MNLLTASLVLAAALIIFVTSPSRLAYHGWLAFLEGVFMWSLVLLPPIQLIASVAVLLTCAESRKSPLRWLLLSTMACSLLAGFFVLAGIASVSVGA